jgi:Flp pilus assembly protein TadG
MRVSHPRRRGTVAVLVAISLTALIGFAAIALDGGLLQHNRRIAQSTADAAALAAAGDLFSNYPTNLGLDKGGTAKAKALAVAEANGYANDLVTTKVTVNIPPQSGPYANKAGYAEVIVEYYQTRYFSTLWGSDKVTVRARAVARAYWGASGTGILILDPTLQHSLDASGTGEVKVTGGANVIVDSNHADAARVTGGGGLTAQQFLITGGFTGPLTGAVKTGVSPTPDPLAYLKVPPVPPDGKMTTKSLGQGNKQYTLTPGRYTNLPTFNSGDEVILQQASANDNGGIYYLDGTAFKSTGANILMDPNTSGGVMIYNNPTGGNNQGIGISGGSGTPTINLSALTSGPYAGILFWQNREATQDINISGGENTTLQGTFYAANARLLIAGQGNAHIGSQYISRTLTLSGGGNFTIDYTDEGTARIREIKLVE